MIPRLALPVLLLLLAAGPASAAMHKGVSTQALIAQARITPVAAVDYDQERCDQRTVEQWLAALTAPYARKIVWTAGPCRIVGPGIDTGSDWCAQATVILDKPLDRRDRPMIEVFFETPEGGRPGVAYAFRGQMRAADGDDMSRFRKDFEADWTSRFPAPSGAIVDCREANEEWP